MKIPLQEKIAELERRIQVLEARDKTTARTVTVETLQPEWGRMWKTFDQVMEKAFGRRGK